MTSHKAWAGYFEEGCKFFTYKKYDLAREMFLKDIEAKDNGNSYYFLGEIEKNENNFEKAVEYYRLSISKNINQKYKKLAYWNLIVIEEQNGKYGEMVILCRELWEQMDDEGAKTKVEKIINKFLWTNNEEARAAYNEGIEYNKKKMPEKAKEAFYSALRIDPYFLAPKFEIAILLINEENYNYAINYLRDIIDEIPFYGEVHLLLGDIYFKKQLYSNSITHLTKALDYGFLDKKTKYIVQLKTGTSYYETGQYENALEALKAASENNNKALEPLLIMSAIYIRNNDYEQALSKLLAARAIDSKNPEIIYQIGSLYYKKEDPKYVQYFNLLFNKYYKTEDHIPNKYYKAFILLLKNYYDTKKYSDAIKIIETIPDNLKNYEINLISARAYYYQNKYDKAIEYFEMLSIENDDKYLLSVSYAKNGMPDKAKDILWALSNIDAHYLQKAKLDNNTIKKVALDIENEKQKIEEEKRKAEQERILAIEREKAEQERLMEIERKKAEEDRQRETEREKEKTLNESRVPDKVNVLPEKTPEQIPETNKIQEQNHIPNPENNNETNGHVDQKENINTGSPAPVTGAEQ